MKKYENFINVEFSYNGDLGKLQLQTKLNIQFAGKLQNEEIITSKEFQELLQLIYDYFKKELTSALNNIVYTLN